MGVGIQNLEVDLNSNPGKKKGSYITKSDPNCFLDFQCLGLQG